MLIDLSARSTAPEFMDTQCRDFEDYAACLRDLAKVNVVTRTYAPTLAFLRDAAEPFALLDVACGSGDMLRQIRRRHAGAALTGVDLHPWAAQAAEEATPPGARIDFRTGNAFETALPQVDYIISAQFTHHLAEDEVVSFIRWMEARAARGWFINDLHRHAVAYYGFGLLAWAARWHRFVRADGQVSVARSFRRSDWRRMLQAAGLREGDAKIAWHVPFRLCVARRK